jgi:hypothetical protein
MLDFNVVPWLEVTGWPVTAGNRIQYKACPSGICSGKSGTDGSFSPNTSVSPVSIIPPILHTHSPIYHPRCIMFLSQHFSFPCQYHSTNAPYTFTHISPTQYGFSNSSKAVCTVTVYSPVYNFILLFSCHKCNSVLPVCSLSVTVCCRSVV